MPRGSRYWTVDEWRSHHEARASAHTKKTGHPAIGNSEGWICLQKSGKCGAAGGVHYVEGDGKESQLPDGAQYWL